MRAARSTAATALIALAATACGGASKTGTAGSAAFQISKDTPRAGGPLASATWSLYAEPQSLDYAHAYDYPPNTVLANVCEQLQRITPDLKVVPGLATAASPDAERWVYTIRSGVRFHDGSALTAEDVVASLRRHMDPKVGSYWISSFQNVASIDKTGPMQVTVRLKRPDQLFNEEMGTSAGTIESARFLAKAGAEYGTPDGGVDCTGPYALESWQKGQAITLKKVEGYWDPSLAPKTSTIKNVFIQDPAARVNALLSGQVDGGYLLPPSGFAKLRASSAGKLYFGPNTTAVSLIPTNLKGTLGDVRVRRALSMALDRAGIIKAGAAGVGTPAQAPAATGAWAIAPAVAKTAYAGLPRPTRDVAAAKKLVREAGATGRRIVMATSTLAPEIAVIANAVQSAGREIGLDVRLRTVAPDAYTALFSDPKARAGLDLVMTTWYDSTPDPLEFYGILQSGNFSNYGGYSNPRYDRLVNQAEAEPEPQKRAAVVAELQRIAVGDLVWIPLYEVPHSLFLNKRVTGAPTSIAQLEYPWAAPLGAAG
ncbi:ABC transporter substrate-binding protein [Spirillospora sp. NPDC046719]